jgi:outer membrane lipoprotein
MFSAAAWGRPSSIWLWVLFLAGLSGCMQSMSSDVMMKVNQDQTFTEVIKDPEAHIGSTVLWGGVIKEIQHGPGEITFIVAQVPLNSSGHPKNETPEGEFVVHTLKPLDPKVFHPGMKVTLAGEIEAVEVKGSGREDDPLPVLRVIEIHAWAEKKRGTLPLFGGWEINQYLPSIRPMGR